MHFLQVGQCVVCGGFTTCAVSAQRFDASAYSAYQTSYTECPCGQAVAPNEVFGDLRDKSGIHNETFRYVGEEMSRTVLKASFVGVTHIPGSENTIQMSASTKRTNENRKAICRDGLVGASGWEYE
jgi:hypothetical protein